MLNILLEEEVVDEEDEEISEAGGKALSKRKF